MMKRTNIVTAALAAGALILSGCSASASSDTSGNDGSGSDAPVTVDTLKGEVEIPADPENVVALNTPSADVATQLGTTPVAVAASPNELNAWQQGVLDDSSG